MRSVFELSRKVIELRLVSRWLTAGEAEEYERRAWEVRRAARRDAVNAARVKAGLAPWPGLSAEPASLVRVNRPVGRPRKQAVSEKVAARK